MCDIRCNHCMNTMEETPDNPIYDCDKCGQDDALMDNPIPIPIDAIQALRELIIAINSNIETVNMPTFNWRDNYVPMVPLQYIADELGNATNFIK